MVFYYSRSGKTKLFAQAVGEVVGYNVQELESALNDKSPFAFIIKSLGLTFSQKSFPVSNMPSALPQEIYVCSPIWGGQVAAPVKYFLENAKLQDTTVHFILTASVPVEKYRQNALNLLQKISCITGNAYIFATSSKITPEIDVIKEQFQELINT
ncbi:MAG: hypothetical protein FWG87_10965 [Defluviitaleaceae bacterium]|nr:hypothetical protein [Defluviitaleaceae bacterium]